MTTPEVKAAAERLGAHKSHPDSKTSPYAYKRMGGHGIDSAKIAQDESTLADWALSLLERIEQIKGMEPSLSYRDAEEDGQFARGYEMAKSEILSALATPTRSEP